MYISINELCLRRIFFFFSWTNAIMQLQMHWYRETPPSQILHSYGFFLHDLLFSASAKIFQLCSGFGSFVLDSYELLWDLSYYSTSCHHFFDNWRRQTWVANEGDATRHLGAPCFRWLRRKSRRTLGLNSFEIAFTFQTFNVLWSRKYHMLHQFMKRKSRLNAIYVTTPVV